MSANRHIGWCRNQGLAADMAAMFADDFLPDDGTGSSRELRASILDEFVDRSLASFLPREDDPARLLAYLSEGGYVVAIFLVSLTKGTSRSYATIEDMMSVDAAAGHGQVFLDWLSAECASRGIERVVMEPGIANAVARVLVPEAAAYPPSLAVIRGIAGLSPVHFG